MYYIKFYASIFVTAFVLSTAYGADNDNETTVKKKQSFHNIDLSNNQKERSTKKSVRFPKILRIIPKEINQKIYNLLTLDDKNNYSLVCKVFNRLDRLWRTDFGFKKAIYWNQEYLPIENNITIFNIFRNVSYLSGYNIKLISAQSSTFLRTLKGVTHLDLGYILNPDNMDVTDENISAMNHNSIICLNLAGNSDIKTESLHKFINVTFLNLRENYNITEGSVQLLHKLKQLNLSKNEKITDDGVKLLTNLTSLDLTENHIVTDDSVRLLTNLTSLNLTQNRIITDESVRLLTNLASLNLTRNNTITEETLRLLTRLTVLNR